MDSQVAAPTPNTQSPTQPKSSPESASIGFKAFVTSNKKKLMIGGVVALVLILTGLFFFTKNSGQIGIGTDPGSTGPGGPNASIEIPKNAIAKVGDEYIFQSDLDIELANYPFEKDDKTKKVLVDKLVKDSIILQAANKSKILALNPAVYNSPGKDYGKRVSDVAAIEKKINSGVDQVSGGVVSIWFHNYQIPKMGLEKAKQIAFEKVSALREKVVKKEMTIEEAGKAVQNDSSLGAIDVGYRSNAYVSFTENKGQSISVDEKFNQLLWSLKPGEVSPVFLGWTINIFNTKEEQEAFYAFGQLSSKIENGNSQDFSKWYEAQKPNYEVTYY